MKFFEILSLYTRGSCYRARSGTPGPALGFWRSQPHRRENLGLGWSWHFRDRRGSSRHRSVSAIELDDRQRLTSARQKKNERARARARSESSLGVLPGRTLGGTVDILAADKLAGRGRLGRMPTSTFMAAGGLTSDKVPYDA